MKMQIINICRQTNLLMFCQPTRLVFVSRHIDESQADSSTAKREKINKILFEGLFKHLSSCCNVLAFHQHHFKFFKTFNSEIFCKNGYYSNLQ